jgi:hypothetical protein
MPQFDTFIFSSNLFYFIITLVILFFVNYIIPKYGALLKLRVKIFISNFILNSYQLLFICMLILLSLYLISYFLVFSIMHNMSDFNIMIEKLLILLALFVENDDHFGFILITITVIGVSELVYYKVTGHHSYLFTKLIYNPNDHIEKPKGSLDIFYASLEIDLVPFETLFIIMIPVCIILTFCLIYIVSHTFKKIGNVFYFILPIFIVTFAFFYSPAVMMISSIILAAIILLVEFYPVRSQNDYKNLFYNYLWDLEILPFFIRLHALVFYKGSSLKFLFLLLSTYLLSFFYVVLSRYYLYYTVASPKQFSYFYLILVLIGIFSCLSAFVLRLFINLSTNLVFSIKANNPSLWANVLLMEPDLDPDSVTPHKPVVSNSIFAFHRHHHRYNIPPNRFSMWQKAGFTVGVCTLVVGCVAAYYSYNSYLQSVRSADAAHRAADLGEVNAGLMSKEEYYQKWKNN